MRSVTETAKKYPLLTQGLTWLMRLTVGGLFLFSGFTKGIDVWGTIFKFNEYFSVWGYQVWDALVLSGVFLLCLAEFITGVFLVTGCFRRTAPLLALLIMIVMLPLTLWLAIANPITDCGCFGDALKLTNWETFFKNIIITIGAIWLLFFNKYAACLITPYLQWIATLASGLYILSIAWLGYYYQPLIDFRPYKAGTPLIDVNTEEEQPDEEDYLRFVYEKDGEKKEFTIYDELPDENDGWEFVERYYYFPEDMETGTAISDISKPTEKNIRFFSEDGKEDMTEEAVGHGKQMILTIPQLSEVSAARTWVINSLYDWCKKNNVEMLATVGGNPYEIEQWKDLSLAEYPIYTSDDTAIEEVVRGNPGLVYLEDGIIKWKSSLRAIDVEDFRQENVTTDPMAFARDNNRILGNLTWILAGVIVVLIFLSYTPKALFTLLRPKKRDAERNKEDEDAG